MPELGGYGWGMNDDISPWILVAACIAGAWWAKSPVSAALPVFVAHEVATPPSCEGELRQLLELHDKLEWYRLLVQALCAVLAGLLCLLGIVAACACGCCARCLTRPAPREPRVAPVARRGDPTLLALLAVQEVRC